MDITFKILLFLVIINFVWLGSMFYFVNHTKEKVEKTKHLRENLNNQIIGTTFEDTSTSKKKHKRKTTHHSDDDIFLAGAEKYSNLYSRQPG